MSQKEEELLAQGWVRRFVEAPPRLKEVVELYKSLGYEVRLEADVSPRTAERCRGCLLAFGLFRVIYTRSIVQEPLDPDEPPPTARSRDKTKA